jgi:hypothetical protein
MTAVPDALGKSPTGAPAVFACGLQEGLRLYINEP